MRQRLSAYKGHYAAFRSTAPVVIAAPPRGSRGAARRSSAPSRPGETYETHIDLPRLSESIHHLVCPAPDQSVEYTAFVIIIWVSQGNILSLKNKSSRLNLTFHLDRVDPVQCFGVPQTGTRFSNVIDDEEDAAGLQSFDEPAIELRDIGWPKKGIMQVVIVLRRPDQIEFFRHLKFSEGPGQHCDVRVARILGNSADPGRFAGRAIGNLLRWGECIDVSGRAHYIAENSGEKGIAGHEVCNTVSGFHPRKGDSHGRLAGRIEPDLRSGPSRV